VTNSSHSAQNTPNSGGLATYGSTNGAPALAPTLASLFPSRVAAAQLTGSGDPATLLPEEAAFVQKAVLKRRQEFAAGRACARLALSEFGVANSAIFAAPDRQPIWPPAFTGSITHTGGFCAAVVAQRHVIRSLGIDTETVGDVGRDLWTTICNDAELRWLLDSSADSQIEAATLVFSAKEALYKCQYPLTGEWLDFHDLEVTVSEAGIGPGGDFSIRAVRPVAFERFAPLPMRGRYLLHDRYITAAIAVLPS
jgi:4'-phosphopantetheinyl transferase EntD